MDNLTAAGRDARSPAPRRLPLQQLGLMTRSGLVSAAPGAFDASPMRDHQPYESCARTPQGSWSRNYLVHNALQMSGGIFLDTAPIWCYPMQMPRSVEPSGSDRDGESPRITVTLRKADYEEVCRLAHAKKVSNAWVIRDAVGRYIEAEAPLLRSLEWSR